MKHFLLFPILFILHIALFAQSDARIAQGTQALDFVEQAVMPAQDNAVLLSKEMSLRKAGRADHFAVPMQVHITPNTHGTWEQTEDGIDIWRLRIYSKDAKSLNLGFHKYIMPKGGSMILYTADYSETKGPFTPSDNEEHEQLWTPVLLGDEIVIEVQLPLNNKADLVLELSAINHDFIGFQSVLSGSCNVDVLCGAADGFPDVDNYRNIIQSVAFMHLNGFANCTGFLVNNTGQDCKPYFMTAYHCDVDAASAPTLVTYWNFQNSYCREPGSTESGQDGDGMLDQFNSGSVLRSSWQATDFVLVELDDPVSEEFSPYFAGWSAEEVFPETAIAIHHPSNDEKRISFEYDDSFYTGTWDGGSDNIPDGDHIVVEDWDVGTTEGGSSGSPLFDQNKRVIGQLHGGGAACGNDSYDTYGWFAKSWEGGGTADTRLRDWLDPVNSGVKTMDGNNCSLTLSASFLELCNDTDMANIEINTNNLFTGTVNLSIENAPSTINTSFTDTQINPNSSTALNLSNLSALDAGTYNIIIGATDGQISGQTLLTIRIFESEIDKPILITPSNTASNVPTFTNFMWQTDVNVQNSQIQVATDADFVNLVEAAAGISLGSFNDFILDAETIYYWRVRSNNLCGESSWSSTFSFTTTNTQCNPFTATDLPISISEGSPDVYESTITIQEEGIVEDVNVLNIIGTHSFTEDLIVSVISPAGTAVILWQDQCNGNDDFNINFDDAATVSTISCPLTGGNTFQPAGNLSDFNGEQAQGDWILRIEDTANLDGGALQNWELLICSSSPSSLLTATSGAIACNNQDYDFTINIGNGFGSNVSLTNTISPNINLAINYDVDINNVPPGTTINATISDFGTASLGDYSLVYTATDGTNTASTLVGWELMDAPSATTLLLPTDAAMNVQLNPFFQWNVATGSGYFIELATDANFNNIVHTNNIQGASYQLQTNLEAFTEYHWRIANLNECGSALSEIFTFTTNDMVPVQELENNSLQIHPNPTNGRLYIQLKKGLQQKASLDIYNLNGQGIHQQVLNANQVNTTVDLSNYPAGMYMLRITSTQGIMSERIIVQ